MISISIRRDSLGALPLLITDASKSSDMYSLMPGYAAGESTPVNTIAKSRWMSGGVLTATKRDMTAIQFTMRVNGSSLETTQAAIATFAQAVNQFDYTVNVSEGSTITTYQCLPATWKRMFDRNLMRSGRDYVTVSIPRQP